MKSSGRFGPFHAPEESVFKVPFIVLLLILSVAIPGRAQSALEVAETFYSAFERRDFATMGSLYQEGAEVVFSDAIFENLSTPEARAMWKMLLGAVQTWDFRYRIEQVDETTVHVVWDADYVFPSTGRQVANHVNAVLKIENGRIVSHVDDFPLCRWARQAYGWAQGTFLCLTPDFTLRPKAREKLEFFMQAEPDVTR